jgi:hypothetical protein
MGTKFAEHNQSTSASFYRFFQSLPMPPDTKKWAVYAVALEKDGCTPALYVSSGTDSVLGAARRMLDYEIGPGKTNTINVSLNVARKINDGFRITAKGYLGWINFPKASEMFRMRCLMVGLFETAFSMIFWTMKSRKHCGMPDTCPWDIEEFSYEGYEVS